MSLLLNVFCLAILISNCRKTEDSPVTVAEPYCSDIKNGIMKVPSSTLNMQNRRLQKQQSQKVN